MDLWFCVVGIFLAELNLFMLVDIDKSLLGFGMFVEGVACPLHEFRKRRFILKSQSDLDAILRSSALKIQINTALGHDVGDSSRKASGQRAKVAKALEHATDRVGVFLGDAVASRAVDLDGLCAISSVLGKAVEEAPDVVVKVSRLKTKDNVTYLHSVAVSALMMRVGQIIELADDVVAELGIAGLVHDLGKLLIDDAVLKKPGALQADEKARMRRHPEIGHELLKSSLKATPLMLDVCLWHHELLDGTGYPHGRKGADLPLHCRIAAVCDVFEALTSSRPYKAPWPIGKALKWLYDQPERYDYRIVGRLHEGIMRRPLALR
jgi:HD-GYP domain-containing protein (c-di-GMP phosphodiesterase class II)